MTKETTTLADQVVDDEDDNAKKSLNAQNYINLASFVLNVGLTYAIGVAGIGGLPNNSELSAKYQTLVTPAGWAFTIWPVIFAFQAAFAITQMLPSFRGLAEVQQGVSYWFLAACIFQMGWTIVFALEAISISVAMILFILVSILGLVFSQEKTVSDPDVGEIKIYWLLKFPHQIWGGWILAASAVNVNVLLVELELSVPLQLSAAIVSIAVLHAAALSFTFYGEKPNYVFPAVLAFATGGIASELSNPQSLVADMSTDITNGVKYASLAVCIIIAAQIIGRFVTSLVKGVGVMDMV